MRTTLNVILGFGLAMVHSGCGNTLDDGTITDPTKEIVFGPSADISQDVRGRSEMPEKQDRPQTVNKLEANTAETESISELSKTSSNSGLNVDPSHGNAGPTSDLRNLKAHQVRLTYKPGYGVGGYAAYLGNVLKVGAPLQDLMLNLTQESLSHDGNQHPFDCHDPTTADRCRNNYTGDCVTKWQNYVDSQYAPQISAVVPAMHAAMPSSIRLSCELWNEPDQRYQCSGASCSFNTKCGDKYPHTGIPPQAMRYLMNKTAPVLAPYCRVVVGGLDSGQTAYVNNMGTFTANALAIHLYPPGGTTGEFEGTYSGYTAVAGRPVIITEWGGTSGQAARVAAFFASSLLSGVEAYYYAYSDVMNPNFGLIDASGGKKAAYNVFKAGH